MPRFFFHVLNNRAILDAEGTEYGSFEEARVAAVRTAGEILVSEDMKFWENGNWRMAVADESGVILFTLDFSAKTHGAPPANTNEPRP